MTDTRPTHTRTRRGGERGRARAWLNADPAPGADVALVYDSLSLVSNLPDRPLVLDATATPAKVAALYGVSEAAVTVLGNEPREVDMHVTRVLDGQLKQIGKHALASR